MGTDTDQRLSSVIADPGSFFPLCCTGYAGFSLSGSLLHHPWWLSQFPASSCLQRQESGRQGEWARPLCFLAHLLVGNRISFAISLPEQSRGSPHLPGELGTWAAAFSRLLFEGGQGKSRWRMRFGHQVAGFPILGKLSMS